MEEDWVREHLITWLRWVCVARCWQWGLPHAGQMVPVASDPCTVGHSWALQPAYCSSGKVYLRKEENTWLEEIWGKTETGSKGFLWSTGKGSHARVEGSVREVDCHRHRAIIDCIPMCCSLEGGQALGTREGKLFQSLPLSFPLIKSVVKYLF